MAKKPLIQTSNYNINHNNCILNVYVLDTIKFIYSISLDTQNHSMLHSFYRQGNWGLERLHDSPKFILNAERFPIGKPHYYSVDMYQQMLELFALSWKIIAHLLGQG